MPVIVTADNIPDVLAQIAERQDEQAAAIELLAGELADQSLRTEQQDDALRTQAAALRVTAAQLSKNISAAAKATRQNSNGTGSDAANGSGSSNGSAATDNGASNGNGNSRSAAASRTATAPTVVTNRNSKGIAGAGVGGEANLGPIEAAADISGNVGNGNGQSTRKPTAAKAVVAPVTRRWI